MTTHYIKNRWLPGEGEPFTAIDPTTGSPSWQGRAATASEVDAAVQAARAAFESWSDTPLAQRIAVAEAFAKAIKAKEGAIAESISISTGKPLWETTQEAAGLVTKVTVSIEAYKERCGERSRDIGGAKAFTRYKPQGVMAILGPFNMPAHLPNGQIVPALIAGDTVVFKPSEQTPLVGQRMMEVWHEVGLPAGVVNMVQGGRDTGIALAQHAGIDGLLFTGSHAAGLALSRTFAETPERILALEMGGNNPLIVDGVKDLKAAAYYTIQSAYITSGQRCTCARRLIVVENAGSKRFIDALLTMAKAIRVGRWNDAVQPFMGPVISRAAAGKVLAAQGELIARRGVALKSCEAASGDAGGAMITPGLIDVTNVKERADVEVFGPLLQLIRVPDFDEAIRVANDTRYGLAAGLLCEDRATYEKFYRRIRAGVVQWNRQTTGASGQLPFGGVGRSGNNRPAGYFVADACSYALAVYESERVTMPAVLSPGVTV